MAVVEVVGNFVDNISGGMMGLVDVFNKAWDAIQPFVDAASESEQALSNLDVILNATSGSAGTFSETIGKMSATNLDDLYNKLGTAKDRLGELEEAMKHVKNPTDAQTIALEAQREKVALLTNQIERGTEGITIFRDTTQLSRDALIDLSKELESTAGFSDELVLSAETMMLRFENVNSKIFPDAIRLAADLSKAIGIDLTTAAQVVGRALDDPEAGIGRLNMQFRLFNDTEMETIKNMAANGDIAGAQATIMERLTEKVGGAAEAYGTTFAGKLDIVQEKFGDMAELIGGPILAGFSTFLSDIIDSPIWTESPIIKFFERFNELLNADAPFMKALGLAILDFRELSPILEDIGIAILTFNTALESGLNPLQSFQYTISKLADPNLFPILSDLFKNFDLSALGEAFINWTLSIDWNKISDNIAAGIRSIDWGKVGNVIAEALGYLAMGISVIIDQIDWGNVFNSIVNALADLMAGLFGFINWEDMISSAEAGFRYVGQAIVDGLRHGLLSTWENFLSLPFILVDDFIRAFHRLLGISSPSSIFAGIGRDIVLGLIGGFTAYWDDLIRIATSSLDDFLNMFGIDLSFGGTSGGTLGGGTGTHVGPGGGTTIGGTSTNGQTVINIYGASYWGISGPGDVGGVYDCPSPHTLVASSGNQLVTTGF